jgi:hypothetical protein
MKDREWWVSCKAFTCWVKTAGEHGTKIIDAAPIAKRWIGQNFLRFIAYYNAERKLLNESEEKIAVQEEGKEG